MNSTLVEENIKLAGSMASSLYVPNNNFEFEDIHQICRLGLVKAANTFDGNRGCKFSTYAYRVMKNEVYMFLKKEVSKGFLRNSPLSLDVAITGANEEKSMFILDILGEYDAGIENVEIEDLLNSTLNFREKYVLCESVLNRKDQVTIASELKITQPHVSRIKLRALKKLRIALAM